MARPLFHHRTPQYQQLFREVSGGLQGIFKTRHPVYTFASSGTGAMEAALVNFHSPGDEVLVVEAGKFGERFTHLAQAYGLVTHVLKVPYGEAVSPEQVDAETRKFPQIQSVCLQLCETSTGVVLDLRGISRRLKGSNALLIVDAISGLGADRFEMDEWGIDLGISGSQKGLMLPPGLGFLAVGPRAQARMKEAKLPRYYFNLTLYEKALKEWDTPFTPAISLIVALQGALKQIACEGLEKMLKRSEVLAEYTRTALRGLGLALFAQRPSNALTAAALPAGVEGEELVEWIREKHGISIAGGQGEMKGRIIRMAHMGFIRKKDLDRGLAALKEGLKRKVNR